MSAMEKFTVAPWVMGTAKDTEKRKSMSVPSDWAQLDAQWLHRLVCLEQAKNLEKFIFIWLDFFLALQQIKEWNVFLFALNASRES